MKNSIILKVSICIISIASVLYSHLAKSNELTALKVLIPKLETQLFAIEEENSRLSYEIERFESPSNLMQLAKQCEFSYLRHPYDDEVLVISVAEELFKEELLKETLKFEKFSFQPPKIMVGARAK